MSRGTRSRGRVVEFDVHRGLGALEGGGRRVPFHCIAIADGSRTIAVGTDVSFTVVPKLGRDEAWDIRPLTA